MKSKKIIIYASLATLLLSGSKLTVEARTGADQISEISKEIELQDYETLTVENISLEEVNEYIKQGYTMLAKSETNTVFIRNKEYIKSYTVAEDYVKYPGNYEKLTVENKTYEEANKYINQGYTMLARSEANTEFIRTKVYGKSNEIISDYINNQKNYEKLTVESITIDEINQYSKLGYTLVGLNETSAEFIRNKVYSKVYAVVNDYINNPKDYEKITINTTEEQLMNYIEQGYTLIAQSKTNAELIRKSVNVLRK